MRLAMVLTILRREWAELLRNPLLLATIVGPPIVLTIAPLAVGGFVRGEPLPAELVDQLRRVRPEWSRLSNDDLGLAYGFQQFLLFFLMMPAFIPLSIATFSIIGEKQSRSLEAVLATPVRTSELLTGKALAALTPGLLGGGLAYVAFVALVGALFGQVLRDVVAGADWIAAVVLLGPAIGLLAIVLGIIVSARVSDPRTAQQVGAIIVVPLVAATIAQASGAFAIGPLGYALSAFVTLVVALIGLRIAVVVFGRESILTRWR
jgi:ABC-2 type transport system permease protein